MSDQGSMIVPPLGDGEDSRSEEPRVIASASSVDRFVRGREFVPTDLVRAVESGRLRLSTAEEQLRLRNAAFEVSHEQARPLAPALGDELTREARFAISSLIGNGAASVSCVPANGAVLEVWREYFGALAGQALPGSWEADACSRAEAAFASLSESSDPAKTLADLVNPAPMTVDAAAPEDAEMGAAILWGLEAEFSRVPLGCPFNALRRPIWVDALAAAERCERLAADLARARRLALKAARLLGAPEDELRAAELMGGAAPEN